MNESEHSPTPKKNAPWRRISPFWWAIIAAVIFGYLIGKDRAITDNAADERDRLSAIAQP